MAANLYVFRQWDGEASERIPVSCLGEAWRVARQNLADGYRVSFSLVLAELAKGRRRGAPGQPVIVSRLGSFIRSEPGHLDLPPPGGQSGA